MRLELTPPRLKGERINHCAKIPLVPEPTSPCLLVPRMHGTPPGTGGGRALRCACAKRRPNLRSFPFREGVGSKCDGWVPDRLRRWSKLILVLPHGFEPCSEGYEPPASTSMLRERIGRIKKGQPSHVLRRPPSRCPELKQLTYEKDTSTNTHVTNCWARCMRTQDIFCICCFLVRLVIRLVLYTCRT